jgi:hypothetical protein
MTRLRRLRRSSAIAGIAAGLLAGLLLAGCSSEPVSQATFLELPATPTPADASPASTASEGPAASEPGASAPAASPATTPASGGDAPPPRPGNPTFTLVSSEPDSQAGFTTVTYRITWTAPAGVASRFLVYGLKVCLRDAAKYDAKPCIVRGMKVPVRKLDLLGEAPGDLRSITVSWKIPEVGPGPYWSILMRATNDAGDSIFAIVHSEKVCHDCVY